MENVHQSPSPIHGDALLGNLRSSNWERAKVVGATAAKLEPEASALSEWPTGSGVSIALCHRCCDKKCGEN